MRRLQRLGKLLPLLSFLIILGIGALTLRLHAPPEEHLRRALAWEISRSLGRKTALTASQTSWFSGWRQGKRIIRVTLQQPTLGEKMQPEEVFLRADKLILEVDPYRLGKGEGLVGAVRSLRIIRPQLKLIRDPEGEWNFSDLLALRGKAAPTFQGEIIVTDGTVTLQDFSPPARLARPQNNQLTALNARINFTEPHKANFQLGAKDGARLGKIFLTGQKETLLDQAPSRVNLSGALRLTGVDIGYLWQYRPFSPKVNLAGGKGDLSAYFLFATGGHRPAALDYTLSLTGAQASLALPWISQPARELAGKVRISNGLVQFNNLRGRLGKAEVTGGGYLLAAALGLPSGGRPASPSASSAKSSYYALSFESPKVTGSDLSLTLPQAAARPVAALQGQGELAVSLVGKKKQGAIFGNFSSPDLALGPTPRSGLPNKLADAETRFVYSRKTLAAAAGGNMQGGSAQAALLLSPQRQADFFATLAGVNLQNVALPAGQGELRGALWGNLLGTWQLPADTGPQLGGQLAVSEGSLNRGPQVFPFSRLVADFSYAQGQTHLPRLLLESDYGALAFAGTLTGQQVTGQLEAQALDLGRVGETLHLPMQGIGFASAEIAGPWSDLQVSTRADIFSGRWQGFSVDWLGGQAEMQGKQVSNFSLLLQRGSGEVRLQGGLDLPGAKGGSKLAVTGQIDKAQISEWLPEGWVKQNLSGILDASLALQGTFAQPDLSADFTLHRPALAGTQFDQAAGALHYTKDTLTLNNFLAQVNHSQLSASGNLRRRELDFTFAGEGLDMAALHLPLPNCSSPEGRLSLRGQLQGNLSAPHLTTWLRAEDLVIAERRVGNLEAEGEWDGKQLLLRQCDLTVPGGQVKLTGTLTKPENSSPPAARSWLSDLHLEAAGLPVGLLSDLVDRCADPTQPDSLWQKSLAVAPRPWRGFLTADATLQGQLDNPKGKIDFALTEGSVAGQHLPALEGALAYQGKSFDLTSLTAKEGDALATARGKVTLGGEIDLQVDVHNLNAQVLRPWVQISGLGGSADSFLQISGSTGAPRIRGDLEVSDPVFGNLALERLKIDDFRLDGNSLTLENLRIVKGPHLASLSATLPYGWRQRNLLNPYPLQAVAKLEGQDLSFLTALWPSLGEFSGPLDAQLEIGGTPNKPTLAKGFLKAQGTWQNAVERVPFSLQGQVVDHRFRLEGENGGPGFSASVEKIGSPKAPVGKLSAQGYYDPFAGPPSRWGRGEYEINLQAENFFLALANLLQGRADADLLLRGDPTASPVDKISGTLTVARAEVNVPASGRGAQFSWRPAFSPYLDIQVKVKDITASTSSAQVTFAGDGHIGGRLGYEPLVLTAKLTADKGTLKFPAATAEVKTMEVTFDKKSEAPLQALGSVNAVARVGRYRIDLSGGGPLLPESELRIAANANPPLSNEQTMALLLGLPPGMLGTQGIAGETTLGNQVAQSLSSSFTALAATGLSAPLLRAIGLNELSFGISPLASNVQVGKRLADKLYIYYLSSLGGADRSTLLRFIFDLTPTFSLGITVDQDEQWRYEIQTSRGF